MRIDLTEKEEELYEGLFPDPEPHDFETWLPVRKRMVALMMSLRARDRIPQTRIRYFVDPELNIGGHGNSIRDNFVRNGNSTDEEIWDHPNFLKYLRYMVEGPRLPEAVINRFQSGAEDSLRDGDALAKVARSSIRDHGLDRDAHEEFFKLALECGVGLGEARMIRDAAREAARR